VEFCTDLATWTPVQIPEPADTYSVGIATVTVTDGSPVDTVKVSFPSSAAPDGKLFARIRAEAGRSH
jgi:hypothetical protein